MIRSFPLHTRTWARGIVNTYGFNNAGDLTSTSYSDGTPGMTRTVRRDGSSATVTDSAGTTIYAYSGANPTGESVTGQGQLAGLTLSHPQSQGRRQSFTATLGGVTVSAMGYGYDTRGRLASVSEGGLDFSADFGYASNSDLPSTTVTKSGATTVLTGTRAYDNSDRLASIAYARPGNLTVTSHAYTLDAADRRTRADREDGTAWVYGYNERDEVTSAVKQLANNNPLAGWQQEFSYDNLGNRRFTREGGDTNGTNRRQLDYAANALNQYTQISHPNAVDVLGRAPSDVSVTVNGAAVTRQGEFWRKELGGLPNALAAVWQPVQVDAVDPGAGPNGTDLTARRSGHRYLPKAVETPFYDLDGNLVSDARWTYVWNGENQLIEMSTAAPALAAGVPKERYRFVYDSRSRRIARTVESWNTATSAWTLEKTERFIHDDWNVVAVLNASGAVVQRYAWGNDLSGTPQGAGGVGGLLAARDAASGRSWCYAYDGNGNVSAVVDLADGTRVGRYDYDAFGRTIATWGDEGLAEVNPYRFSTKPLERTGLYYYGYRWYDTGAGRWLGKDPIGERGGWGLYSFIANRPISYVDRLGLLKLIANHTRTVYGIFGTYGELTITVDDPEIKKCCNFPMTFKTLEPPKTRVEHELLQANPTTGSTRDENTPIGEAGRTSPQYFYNENPPSPPESSNQQDYFTGMNMELQVYSEINIHAGENALSSNGCIIIGTTYVMTNLPGNPHRQPGTTAGQFYKVPGFNIEDSRTRFTKLMESVACVRRKNGGNDIKLEYTRTDSGATFESFTPTPIPIGSKSHPGNYWNQNIDGVGTPIAMPTEQPKPQREGGLKRIFQRSSEILNQ